MWWKMKINLWNTAICGRVALGLKRWLANEELITENTKAPQVHCLVVGSAADHLRWKIVQCATQCHSPMCNHTTTEIVYNTASQVVSGVCTFVCPYVCKTVSFKSLDMGSSYCTSHVSPRAIGQVCTCMSSSQGQSYRSKMVENPIPAM